MIEIPIQSRRARRMLRIQQIQHGVPSLALLADGWTRLTGEEAGQLSHALGIAELTVSLVVIGFLLWSMIPKPAAGEHEAAAHHAVDWVDLSLAAMLLVEAWAHHTESGHWKGPTLSLAVVLVLLGLSHGWRETQLPRRRALRITDEGLSVWRRFFRRETFAWPGLDRIAVDDRGAEVIALDGRRARIDLADAANGDEVRAGLAEAARRLEAYRAALESAPTGQSGPPS